MKKGLMIIALTLLPKVLLSYEIEGNPDRKMSVGIGYANRHLTGDFTTGSGAFSFPDSQKGTSNSYFADVRVPLTSILTFSIGGGYLTSTSEFTTTKFTGLNQTSDMKGYEIAVAARFYIP